MGVSSHSTGYHPEGFVKINAGLNSLPTGKWFYYPRTDGASKAKISGLYTAIQPVDVWVIVHRKFDVECEHDERAEQLTDFSDIPTIPRTLIPKISRKETIWLGSREVPSEAPTSKKPKVRFSLTKPTVKHRANRASVRTVLPRCSSQSNFSPKSGNSGILVSNLRRSDKTHEHPKNPAKRITLDLTTNQISSSTAPAAEAGKAVSAVGKRDPSGQIPVNRVLAEAEYRKFFGKVVDDPSLFLFPNKFPPFALTSVQEADFFPEKKKTKLLPKSQAKRVPIPGTKENPLNLDYDSDSVSSAGKPVGGISGNISEDDFWDSDFSDIELLPPSDSPSSPKSPTYSPRNPEDPRDRSRSNTWTARRSLHFQDTDSEDSLGSLDSLDD